MSTGLPYDGSATNYRRPVRVLESVIEIVASRVLMKLDQGPDGGLKVLDSGYTDQVLLDCITQEVLRIKAVVYNSLNDLNKLFHVDRALYTNSPGLPLFFEFTPENVASMKTPLIISEVKLYTVERMWGMSTLRMMK